MSVFDKFEEIRQHKHRYARQWKARTGNKVFGFLCTYVPEEIIYAAGHLPVRIYGSHEPTDITESHITSQWCPYCRDCLAQGLWGRYEYLDGLVYAFACSHIFNAYNAWLRHIPTAYHHHLYIPEHFFNPHARKCLVEETREFKTNLEGFLGKTITDADLDRAFQVYNASSRLMHQIYETRKGPHPHITGAEAMNMVLANSVMDKAEHNELLRQALAEVEQREGIQDPGVRLLLLGSENDDVDFIRFIESLGATVVIDEHCTGSRYFWNEIVPNEDRAAAIADRYISRPPCAHKDLMERERLKFVLQRVQDYHVQGAIFILQKFCDIYEFDIPAIRKLLSAHNIPMLTLEVDITVPVGQFRTRIEAFLETLQLEMV